MNFLFLTFCIMKSDMDSVEDISEVLSEFCKYDRVFIENYINTMIIRDISNNVKVNNKIDDRLQRIYNAYYDRSMAKSEIDSIKLENEVYRIIYRKFSICIIKIIKLVESLVEKGVLKDCCGDIKYIVDHSNKITNADFGYAGVKWYELVVLYLIIVKRYSISTMYIKGDIIRSTGDILYDMWISYLPPTQKHDLLIYSIEFMLNEIIESILIEKRKYMIAKKYYYKWIEISSRPPNGRLFLKDFNSMFPSN
jgi:hypothetical protein